MYPSQLRLIANTSYALYGVIVLVVIILVAQHPSTVSYDIMGSPAIMILMLFVAGIGVSALVGSTMITGTFMSSNYGKYSTGVLVFIMVLLFTYGAISFTHHGKGVTIMAIIISVISFMLFYFQKESMF